MKKAIIYVGVALVAFANVATVNAAETPVAIVKTLNYGTNTPLAVAIMKGDLDAVKKFVEYGADVNEKSNGLSPLMLAGRYNRTDIASFLLEKGAKLRDTDDKGNTALKHAQISNATETVALFKKALNA